MVTLTLSLFQIIVCCLIVFASVALAFVIGVAEGRLREACEPGKKPAEDDGKGLGARVRGRH